MKYLWISLAILVAAFLFCYYTYVVVERDLGMILEYLDEVELYYEQGDLLRASQTAHEMYGIWLLHREHLSSIIRHADVDRAEGYLLLIVRGIDTGSVGVYDAITSARVQLDCIIRSESLTLGNIM